MTTSRAFICASLRQTSGPTGGDGKGSTYGTEQSKDNPFGHWTSFARRVESSLAGHLCRMLQLNSVKWDQSMAIAIEYDNFMADFCYHFVSFISSPVHFPPSPFQRACNMQKKCKKNVCVFASALQQIRIRAKSFTQLPAASSSSTCVQFLSIDLLTT